MKAGPSNGPATRYVTTPPGVTLNTSLLALSTAYRLPSLAKVRPSGRGLNPGRLAKGLTDPLGETRSMRLLRPFETYSLPLVSKARPVGPLNPVAKVVTEPPGETLPTELLL